MKSQNKRWNGLAGLLALGSLVSSLMMVSSAHAGKYGMAGCGLGSLIFEDKPGKSIGIVSFITNNYFFPQSSAITTGSSNCSDSNDRDMASTFIILNQDALAKEMARGDGEALEQLSVLLKCSDSSAFKSSMQSKFNEVFPSEQVQGDEVRKSIQNAIQSNPELSNNCRVFS